jgi:hypothetical protein
MAARILLGIAVLNLLFHLTLLSYNVLGVALGL